MKRFLALMTLMLTTQANAESFFNYGIGALRSSESSIAETKVLALGYRDDVGILGLKKQWEVGLWSDSAGSGRKSSMFADFSIGLEANPGYMVLRSMHGIAWISSPDAYLGSSFPQFNNVLYLGVRDDKSNSIGIQLRHISSAGIWKPNVGRDFVQVELGIPW